jgi:iron complex transport system substrate-binding protein
MKALLSIFIFICILSCSQPKDEPQSEKGKELISYSKNLSIEDFGNYFKVKVIQPASTDSSFFTYILYKDENNKPKVKADEYISIPVEKVICLSTSHLASFTALGESRSIAGFPDTQLIYEQELLSLVESGELQDVGQKNGVNIEKVLSLQADIIMAYTMGSNLAQLKPLRKAGIPILLNSDYLENSPLGRAEWLKLTAVLLDKYEKGDSIFNTIENNYLEIRDKASVVDEKPSIMTGLMYGDVWYVPGGESYAAEFIQDAGGNYLWSSTNKTGSLELSFESVFEEAKNADYWVGVASFTTLKELKNANDKYTLFDAYKNQKVFSYTKKVNENGANDYLESAYLRPDWVLKDYVNLLHPNILEDSSLTYFQSLKP